MESQNSKGYHQKFFGSMDFTSMQILATTCSLLASTTILVFIVQLFRVKSETLICVNPEEMAEMPYVKAFLDLACIYTALVIWKPRFFLCILMEFTIASLFLLYVYLSYHNADPQLDNFDTVPCLRLNLAYRIFVYIYQLLLLEGLISLRATKCTGIIDAVKCMINTGDSDRTDFSMFLALPLTCMLFIVQECSVQLLSLSSSDTTLFYFCVILSFYSFNFIVLLASAIAFDWMRRREKGDIEIHGPSVFQYPRAAIRDHFGPIASASTFVLPMSIVLVELCKRTIQKRQRKIELLIEKGENLTKYIVQV